MELRQLKYFVKTAESLNFTEAARNLSITQSTLSQQIKQLEQEVGGQLFQRNSHTMSLTEIGQELLPYAMETLRSADDCFEHIHDVQQLRTGSLDIGVTFTFSSILTEVMIKFMQEYPDVKIRVHYRSMTELMTMLSRREVDFVLAFKPTRSYREIESHIIFDNRLAVIANTEHPLAKKSIVTLSELEHYDLALPANKLQARNALDEILSKSFCSLTPHIEVDEVSMLLKLVKHSQLVTVLSEASVHNEQGVKAIPLDVPHNEVSGCVHLLRNAYRKHSALKFIQMLSESTVVLNHAIDWL